MPNQGSGLCRKCSGFNSSAEDNVYVISDGDDIEKMAKFSNLQYILYSGGGKQAAVTARKRSGWKSLRI